MVGDWPTFPELRQRTALRMRQVRHRMPEMLSSNNDLDILQQISPEVFLEYVRWVQLERNEGLALNVWDELYLHIVVLPRLLIAHSTYARLLATSVGVVVLAFIVSKGRKTMK